MATVVSSDRRETRRTSGSAPRALADQFLGNCADWYKLTIVGFLVLNPILLASAGGFVAGWALLLEFVFTLAMALRCYPLQPGGLLVFQAVLLGMATPEGVYRETEANFQVILLLIFMVAGISFLRDLLLFIFTRILTAIRSKLLLSLTFLLSAAVLSAFMDALTVTAVIITVALGFYRLYHRVASGLGAHDEHDVGNDESVEQLHAEDLARFRAFLRSLVMHAAVGTALGGLTTLVGEPQNLLIGTTVGWSFVEFFLRMAPVSMPVLLAGVAVCVLVEKLGITGYGARLPDAVRGVLLDYAAEQASRRGAAERAALLAQLGVALFLVAGLVFHMAEVGIVGLCVIVLATALCGIVEERRLGHAFTEALPFTALLVVFFGVVAVIHHQDLFEPLISFVLEQPPALQPQILYLVNGVLSAISDNVFVATIYMSEIQAAFEAGVMSRGQLDLLAVAVNAGTNVPSVATPNGQAAFLFLLTSTLAPLIRLSYARMVWMALPYTVAMTAAGYGALVLFL